MSSTLCLLIPALVGIVAGILGYAIGRMAWNQKEGTEAAALKAELDACRSNSKSWHDKMDALQAELSAAKSKVTTNESTQKVAAAPAKVKKPVAKASDNSFDAKAVFTIIGKKIKHNDLKAIEGIGPKIAELLDAAGIKTWKDLSETSVDQAKEILKAAGDRYAIHNPGTWPRQAKMMQEGKWAELKAWQDTLDGGKE